MENRWACGNNTPKSLQGHLLVASPHLGDERFVRTVILLLRHDEQGAFGLVLNRPVSEKIQRLWRQLGKSWPPADLQLSFGGPVAGPLVALHDTRASSEATAAAGFRADAGLDWFAKPPAGTCRLFIGHAGWSQGQLESELKSGAWFVMRATPEHVFGRDDNLWVTAIRQIGRSVIHSTLKIKHVPEDLSWN